MQFGFTATLIFSGNVFTSFSIRINNGCIHLQAASFMNDNSSMLVECHHNKSHEFHAESVEIRFNNKVDSPTGTY